MQRTSSCELPEAPFLRELELKAWCTADRSSNLQLFIHTAPAHDRGWIEIQTRQYSYTVD